MARAAAVFLVLLLGVSCVGYSPQDADARGRECLARHDLACAVSAFSTAVDGAPREPRYRYNLAVALAKIGALEEARTELEIAVELKPSDLVSRRLLHRVHRAIASSNARLVELD